MQGSQRTQNTSVTFARESKVDVLSVLAASPRKSEIKRMAAAAHPMASLVAADLPVLVQRPSTAYSLLGGEAQVMHALLTNDQKPGSKLVLPLYLRPEDPVSHAVVGEACKSASFLLRVERRVKRRGHGGSLSARAEGQEPSRLRATFLGPVPRTFRYSSMADFQYLPSSCPLVVTAPILSGVFQELREGRVKKLPSGLVHAQPASETATTHNAASNGAASATTAAASTTTAHSDEYAADSRDVTGFGFLEDLEAAAGGGGNAAPFYCPPQLSPYGQPQPYKLSSVAAGAGTLQNPLAGSAAATKPDKSGGNASGGAATDAAAAAAARLSQRRAFFSFGGDGSDSSSGDEADAADENVGKSGEGSGSGGEVEVPSVPLPIDASGIRRLDEALKPLLQEAFLHRPVWTRDALEVFIGYRTFGNMSVSSSSSTSSSSSLLVGGSGASAVVSLAARLQEEYGQSWPKALVAYAYYTQKGAYRNCWLRLGYDPRAAASPTDAAAASLYQYVEAKLPEPYNRSVAAGLAAGLAGTAASASASTSLLYWSGGLANKKRVGVQLIDLFSMGIQEVAPRLSMMMATTTAVTETTTTTTARIHRVLPSVLPAGLFEPTSAMARESNVAPSAFSSSASSASSLSLSLSYSSSAAASVPSRASPCTFVVGMDGRSVFKMSEEHFLSMAKQLLLGLAPMAAGAGSPKENDSNLSHLRPTFSGRVGWMTKNALEGYRAFAQLLLCSYLEVKAMATIARSAPEVERKGTLHALADITRGFLSSASSSGSAAARTIPLVASNTARTALRAALWKRQKTKVSEVEAPGGRGRAKRAAAEVAAGKIREGLKKEKEGDSSSSSGSSEPDVDKAEESAQHDGESTRAGKKRKRVSGGAASDDEEENGNEGLEVEKKKPRLD